MKIRSVYIQNLNSLQLSTQINFCEPPLSEAGLFAITGDTGAGKTTILDAMTLALYGSVARNKQVREVMSYGSTESVAEVEFSVQSEIYRAKWTIWRARGKTDGNVLGPKRELSKYNTETEAFDIIASKIKETDEAVEAISGLDYDRFRRSVLLAQGEFAAFLNADERERSELLERITGTAIYSELSIAAFQRHKRERERLEQLRLDLERLDILDQDGQKDLQNQLLQLEEQVRQVQEEASVYRKAIGRWENRDRLKATQQQIADEQTELQQQEATHRADQEQLQLHRQLNPYAQDLDRWQQLAEREETLLRQLELDKANRDRLRTQRSEIADQFAQQRTDVEVFSQELAAQRRIIDQVRVLDSRIQDLQQNLLTPEAALAEDRQTFTETTAALQRQQQQLASWKKDLEDIQQQLQASHGDADLAAHMGVLEKEFQDWQALQTDIKEQEVALQEAESAFAQKEKTQQELNTHWQKATEKVAQLQAAFRQELPQEWTLQQDQLIDRIVDDLQDLRTRKNNLQQLYQLADEYQKRMEEYNKTNEQLAELSAENEDMDKSVLNLLERRDQLQEQLTYRRSIYLQQQTIANYAKDRQTLAEGEACPLCFSTEHPFRAHEIEPFVDQARREYETAEKASASIQQQLIVQLNTQRELLQLISELRGKQLGDMGGKLARLNDEMEQLELKMSHLAYEQKQLTGGRPGLSLLQNAIQQTQQKIDRFEKSRKTLQTLNQQIEAAEKHVIQLEQRLIKQKAEVDHFQTELQRRAAQTKQAKEREQAITQQLLGKLQKWNIKADTQALEQHITALRQRAQQYQEREARQQVLQPQIAGLENRLAEQTKAIRVLEKRIEQQTQALATQQKQLAELRSERAELFGDADTAAATLSWQQKEQNWKQQLDLSREQLHTIDRELSSLEKLLEEKESRLNEQRNQQEALQTKLQVPATALGFADLAQMSQTRLSPEVVQTLEKSERQWQTRQAAIARMTAEVEKEWAALDAFADAPRAELQTQLQTTDQLVRETNQSIGAIQEKLQQQQDKRKKAEKLLKEIEKQKKETLRWAKLDEIIGQADGKKFRTYAQGLTLQKLIALANQHLQKLNGRYLIHKKADADLELEIVDLYQADNRRSMQTLSGGESFLVSLALALGLSDLAGRNTQISSLFIDEGFGSLDENSLDLAITTLENLQAAGKTIGVISHVKALKERIATQIKVVKSAGGRSRLEVVG